MIEVIAALRQGEVFDVDGVGPPPKCPRGPRLSWPDLAARHADVLAAEGAHKKRDESKADENAARATVLPSGRDSDDEEDEDARDRTVPRANDADELARRAVGAAETRALLRSEMAAGVRARGSSS